MTGLERAMSLDVFTDAVKSYESVVRARPENIVYQTISTLDKITEFCSKGGLADRGVTDKDIDHWYTRLASAMTTFITDPTTNLTNASLLEVSRRKTAISYLFNASGYRGMQHIITQVSTLNADGQLTLAAPKAAMVLAFISLDDVSENLMAIALRQPPHVLLPLYLGWLNQRAVLTARGERNRETLLTSGHLLSGCEVQDTHIPLMVNAWMYCSYASTEQKHEIKRWFNSLLVKRMQNAGLNPKPVVRRQDLQRPKLLVVHERFTHAHAMFRSYGKLIAELRDRFELVALTDKSMIDEPAAQIFDHVIKLEGPRPSVANIASLIEDVSPDLIFYPSLGMSHWTVMLAQLRLAPIQVASLGHPATTHSKEIDYMYAAQLEGDLENVFSETILLGQKSGVYTVHPELKAMLVTPPPPSARQVRVAINSKVMKLSHRLLDICTRLQDAADIEVQFVFFPGERGLYFDGLRAAIKRQLPTAVVKRYSNYAEFLREIAKCDLSLAAFPFGNTNSTVDTSILGLPTVAHFGTEPPSQSDRRVIRMAGLPEWTVCRTDEEYFATALRLINSESERRSALGDTTREKIYENLFTEGSDTEKTILRDILWRVYQSHEQIKLLPKKVWTLKDLNELD